MGRKWKQCHTSFFWAPESLQMVTAAMKLKDAYSLEGKSYQPRQHIKKQRHYFTSKGPSGQSYGFSSGHVGMWELDCEESWAPKNWCFWTMVLDKTLFFFFFGEDSWEYDITCMWGQKTPQTNKNQPNKQKPKLIVTENRLVFARWEGIGAWVKWMRGSKDSNFYL